MSGSGSTTPTELQTVLSVVEFVFARLTAYIGYCNEHPLWLPTGFAIAIFCFSRYG